MLEQRQYIIDNYTNTLNDELMTKTGLTLHQIYRIAHKNGLKTPLLLEQKVEK
jgi:ribonucleotide reductase alpha subunit